MLQLLHPTCPKTSNSRKVGRVKSHIQPVRYQIVPHVPQTVDIFFYLHENPPVCHICFWYFQIFSHVFPWLNSEYWITCRLFRFRCESATAYAFQRSCVLVFLLNLLEFSLSEFLRVFFRCIFLLGLRKKDTGKKGGKKCFSKLSQKYQSITKSFKGKCNFSNPDTSFFGFDLWLSFLLISFFEILSKTFVK